MANVTSICPIYPNMVYQTFIKGSRIIFLEDALHGNVWDPRRVTCYVIKLSEFRYDESSCWQRKGWFRWRCHNQQIPSTGLSNSVQTTDACKEGVESSYLTKLGTFYTWNQSIRQANSPRINKDNRSTLTVVGGCHVCIQYCFMEMNCVFSCFKAKLEMLARRFLDGLSWSHPTCRKCTSMLSHRVFDGFLHVFASFKSSGSTWALVP